MVFGEITTKANVDYEAVVRKACADIGYDAAEKGNWYEYENEHGVSYERWHGHGYDSGSSHATLKRF